MEIEELRLRLEDVRSRIDRAASKAGRSGSDVTLVAVTKTRPVEDVFKAIECGVTDIGENYVQEALEKYDAVGDRVRWHFIGHLQRNKVKQTIQFAALIHSVDSAELVREISKRSVEQERIASVLLEVNVTGEQSKTGIPLDGAQSLIETAGQLPGVRVCGIMGMARQADDPEATRPYFRKLKTLFDTLPEEQRVYLSMGMTQDFEIAIEEGSNMVRVGTAIFGQRN